MLSSDVKSRVTRIPAVLAEIKALPVTAELGVLPFRSFASPLQSYTTGKLFAVIAPAVSETLGNERTEKMATTFMLERVDRFLYSKTRKNSNLRN
jgi:hypothetical protein